MKRARRYLGLFLASLVSLSNVSSISAWADSDISNLKVSVIMRCLYAKYKAL